MAVVLQLKGKVLVDSLFVALRTNTFCNALNISHQKAFGKFEMRNFNILNAECFSAFLTAEMKMVVDMLVIYAVTAAIFAKS